jgi:sialate O-acetylesterase
MKNLSFRARSLSLFLAISATLGGGVFLRFAHAVPNIQEERGGRVIKTDTYEALVESDGAMTSLKIAGQEFLKSSVKLPRGLYLYQKEALNLSPISQTRDLINGKSNKASISYSFYDESIVINATNTSDQVMILYVVFDAGLQAVNTSEGKLLRPFANYSRQATASFFRGKSRLKIEGGDNIAGPWGGQYQLWSANLGAGQTRTVTLSLGAATNEELTQIASLPPNPTTTPNGQNTSANATVASAVPVTPSRVALSPLFSDYMVLQRDVPANIWGEAISNETVQLTLNGKTVITKANEKGEWLAKLPTQKAGGPFTITVKGQNTITLNDVYFGDVWLMSGQSNMEWNNRSILAPEVLAAESATASDPHLRFFTVAKNAQISPTRQIKGSWQISSSETMPGFSATSYFFGRELRSKLGIPIGLINSTWGGTPSEAFTSLEALEKDPGYPAIKSIMDRRIAEYPEKIKIYNEVTLPKWKTDVAKAKAEGKEPPRRPAAPGGGPNDNQRPALLYNGMIAPLIPYTFKGIAWYQGESNGDHMQEALDYKTLFPTLINDWRSKWGQNLPFLFVQLASHRRLQEQPSESAQRWPYVREAQTAVLSLPNTGMTVVLDNTDPDNIHPKDKVTVGKRLADVALGTVYNQKLPYTGPLFESMEIEANAAIVKFAHTDGGLKAKDDTLKGFAIAGEDGVFVWADAKIVGDSVVLSNPQISKPVSVRYGWADNPIGNLQNGVGLPASPFRTDKIQPAINP